MRAVRYHEFGGTEVLRWEEAPDPRPGPGDVLVRVEAAGVNFADLMRRQGRYHFTGEFPAMLGTEAAGTVVRIGADVAGVEPGDRVFCRTSAPGCQAEMVVVPVSEILRTPAESSSVEAAAIPVVFITAYHMLKTLAPLGRGESVLVHAAASGVGTAAVQLAKVWGARVFATASTEEKLALAARLGADECINYRTHDFVPEVLRRTAGVGVDRVLDCVGGEVLAKSVKALAPGGRLVIYGRASGDLPMLSPDEFFARNLQLFGLNIGGAPWALERHRAALEECLTLIAGGKVRPVISSVFKMADVARAHAYLAERRTMGKVVLVP